MVAGATGGVGSRVVQCLVNEGVKVRALVRDYTKVVRQPYIARSLLVCATYNMHGRLPSVNSSLCHASDCHQWELLAELGLVHKEC